MIGVTSFADAAGPGKTGCYGIVARLGTLTWMTGLKMVCKMGITDRHPPKKPEIN